MAHGAELVRAPSAADDAPRRLTERSKSAQQRWREQPLDERLRIIASFRRRLAVEAEAMAASVTARPPAETLAAELLPLLECCRFLERRAARVLRAERRRGRNPLWLRGTVVDVVREPYGIVLIVAPGNYGLMLAGIQALHALTAGNAVILKPAPGSGALLERFAALLVTSGLPPDVLSITGTAPQTARALLASGVDKLVFTGSSAAGRDLLKLAAAKLVPATLELSGWDACIVLDDADLDRTAAALAFALALNGGRTCVSPRRVIASAAVCRALEVALVQKLAHCAPLGFDAPMARVLVADALAKGARLVSGRVDDSTGPVVLTDVTPGMPIFSTEAFGPIALLCAARPEKIVDWANRTPYALGVTIFGSERRARELVPQLQAGIAMINDAIVPAGHGAVPIAARGGSGFGVTRGPEGLLAMTRPKAVTATRARRPFHLLGAPSAPLLAAYALAAYGGGIRPRLRALAAAARFLRRSHET